MRRPMTMLTLVSVCGLLALAAVAALGASLIRSSGSSMRSWPVTLSPQPGDLALAQISFHPARRLRLSASALRATVSGPFGDDYLAVAGVPAAAPRVQRALVLLVNRASPLLDPVLVHLKLAAKRALGPATIVTLENPLTPVSSASARTGARTKASLCDLPLHGSPLAAGQLRALGSRGSPLDGFAAASAVAQAYDLACGLPHASAFKQLVERPSASSQPPTPTAPTQPPPTTTLTTPTSTTPTPSPPVGTLPGEGCQPAPGYACPG